MPSAEPRRGDRHRHPPVAYRPPADIRPRLEARMRETGQGLSAIITEALRRYLADPGTATPPE